MSKLLICICDPKKYVIHVNIESVALGYNFQRFAQQTGCVCDLIFFMSKFMLAHIHTDTPLLAARVCAQRAIDFSREASKRSIDRSTPPLTTASSYTVARAWCFVNVHMVVMMRAVWCKILESTRRPKNVRYVRVCVASVYSICMNIT